MKLDKNYFTGSKLLFWTVWILVVMLILYVGTQVNYLFHPIYVLFSTLFMPTLIAGFLFYLLNPLIKMIEKTKIERIYVVIGVMLLVIGGALSFIVAIVPVLIQQLSELITNIPEIAAAIQLQAGNLRQVQGFETVNIEEVLEYLNLSLETLSASALATVTAGLNSILSAVTDIAILTVTVPIFLFYMFHDGHKFQPAMVSLFPKRYRNHVAELLSRTNRIIAAYLSGKGLASVMVGVLVYIGLIFIGVPYSLLLAIISGVTNLIPYIGPFIGAVPAVVIGLTVSPGNALLVALLILVIQQVDANLLTPKFVGHSLDIHPLTIIAVLLVAGNMAGMIGIIFGVPGFAIIKTIVVYIKDIIVNKQSKGKKPKDLRTVQPIFTEGQEYAPSDKQSSKP